MEALAELFDESPQITVVDLVHAGFCDVFEISLAGFDLIEAGVLVGGDDGLEVIDVIEVNIGEGADGLFDVAGDGEIEEEKGAVAAAFKDGLEGLFGEDGIGGAGGGDDDVGSGEEFGELFPVANGVGGGGEV